MISVHQCHTRQKTAWQTGR